MSVLGSFVGVRVRSDFAKNSKNVEIGVEVRANTIRAYVRVNSNDINLYLGKQ